MLQKVDVSKARETLSSLMEQAYFGGEKFVILRRGIPMAVIMGIGEIDVSPQKISPIKKEVCLRLFGIWKTKKGSSSKIADSLRKKAWESHAN